MLGSISSQFSKAALTYTGMLVLNDVASALGKGVVSAIESVLPSSNNPSHLGSKIDTKA